MINSTQELSVKIIYNSIPGLGVTKNYTNLINLKKINLE